MSTESAAFASTSRRRTIRVEYDATRLNEATVESLLRSAGLDVREKLALV